MKSLLSNRKQHKRTDYGSEMAQPLEAVCLMFEEEFSCSFGCYSEFFSAIFMMITDH